MAARYQVRLYDTSGTLITIFTDFNALTIDKKVNEVSNHIFSMWSGDEHVDHSLFHTDGFVEVLRSDPAVGLDWYVEYVGFHRTPRCEITDAGRDFFTSYGRGMLDLIGRRTLRYHAATAYTDKSGPADDVIKAFVRENAGSLAASPPRITNGVITGLGVAADLSLAPTWEGSRVWKGLLETIQEIAKVSGVDFDVAKTGPSTFEFRTYYPQLGTDRSATVIFSTDLGNMGSPVYTLSRTEEANDTLVLGQGQEEDRETVNRTTSATGESPWNRIEDLYNSNQEATVAALEDAGDARLEELQANESFQLRALQTSSLMYGRDYFLGDLVTARFKDIERVKKVVGVRINVADGKEDINIEFSNQP